jgi:hypothetical protein
VEGSGASGVNVVGGNRIVGASGAGLPGIDVAGGGTSYAGDNTVGGKVGLGRNVAGGVIVDGDNIGGGVGSGSLVGLESNSSTAGVGSTIDESN